MSVAYKASRGALFEVLAMASLTLTTKIKMTRYNLKYSLRVSEGSNSESPEDVHDKFIGSEIEPILIGRYVEGHVSSGTEDLSEYYLIVQSKEVALVEKIEEYRNGQGTFYDFIVRELPIKGSLLLLDETDFPK